MALISGIINEEDGQGTLLLSSEAFQNVQDVEIVRHMMAHFGARNVQVICYVQEHLDYAVSAYRQMV